MKSMYSAQAEKIAEQVEKLTTLQKQIEESYKDKNEEEPAFVSALRDATLGLCTSTVELLAYESRKGIGYLIDPFKTNKE